MVMLADQYEYVIGGDPDRDTIDLAVIATATGVVCGHHTDRADGPGYRRLINWALRLAPGRRVWALEGTGSFAAGLAAALAELGEDVVEVNGGKRRRGAKNDRLDAVRAARVALARDHQAEPRSRGLREALRQILVTRQAVLVSRTKAINERKSLIVVAPEHLRVGLRGASVPTQLQRITELSSPTQTTIEHRVTVLTLQSIAARIQFLIGQAAELDRELAKLVQAHQAGPALLARAMSIAVGYASPASVPSSLLSCLSPGHTAAGSAAKPHSHHWPGSRRWKPAAANAPGTDSTAAVIATSTAHCTPSPSPGCAATRNPVPTRSNAPPKARPTATSGDPSNAPSHDASTAESKPPPHHGQPLRSRPRPRLDKHRCVQRPAAPILPQRNRPGTPQPRRPRRRRRRTQQPATKNARLGNPS